MSGAYRWAAVRRYPLAPVVEVLKLRGLTAKDMFEATGLHGSSWKAAAETGLIPKAADRVATRIGRHPLELWPSWDRDAAEDDLRRRGKKCAECGELYLPIRGRAQRFCSADCREAAARERRNALERARYHRDPEKRMRRLETERAYRAEYREYVLQQKARYRAEHRDVLRAKKRAYDEANRARKQAADRERYQRKKAAAAALVVVVDEAA